MKLLYIILILSSLTIVACKDTKQHFNDETDSKISGVIDIDNPDTTNPINNVDSKYMTPDTVHIDEYYDEPLVINYTKLSDTMVINEECVLFLWIDSLEVSELQKTYPNGYIEILDEMITPVSDAAIALDAEGIKNLICDKSIIQFNNDFCIKRKDTKGNMIFFKLGKKPLISYAIDFNLDSCLNYFSSTEDHTVE